MRERVWVYEEAVCHMRLCASRVSRAALWSDGAHADRDYVVGGAGGGFGCSRSVAATVCEVKYSETRVVM